MTYLKIGSAAVIAAGLLVGPALADPTETAKAVGKDARWAQSAQFDGKTLTLSGVSSW